MAAGDLFYARHASYQEDENGIGLSTSSSKLAAALPRLVLWLHKPEIVLIGMPQY